VKDQFHVPVLMQEILDFFGDVKLHYFLDGTMGAAGHAKQILENHPEVKIYIGCDKDTRALEIAKEKLASFKDKVKFKQGDFANIESFMKEENIDLVDGVLLDLGVSSMQLESKERGFSFMYEAPLDMRMDRRCNLTAEKVVNEYPEKVLAEIFQKYGEEFRHRQVAKAIAIARKKKRIKTTVDLLHVIMPTLQKKRKRIHPATLVFQALRIFVNKELESIEIGINKAIKMLKDTGKIAVISFHSLEDRIVKNIFRSSKDLEVITKKPIRPTFQEIKENPRSRSSKLRFAKKIIKDVA
jgi:16S rRNA (cytosine1402-N4)-methyltransferase